MNTDTNYELLPVGVYGDRKGVPVTKTRVLVGRSNACDIVMPYQDISAIHAVLEVKDGVFSVYDMNSTNGTYINGNRVAADTFNLNDEVKFAAHSFIFKHLDVSEIVAPPLDILDNMALPPVMGEGEVPRVATPSPQRSPVPRDPAAPPQTPATEQVPPSPAPKPKHKSKHTQDKEFVPRVEYPLARDPKAEFSEYIFEDVEDLYPIFNYNIKYDSVEVIILVGDTIWSVDYLPIQKGTYNIAGYARKSRELEYAHLMASESHPFVRVDPGDEVFVEGIPGYKAFSISGGNKEATGTSLLLGYDEILRFQSGDLQIFVRRTHSPPKVAAAPILRRDKGFKKYLFIVLLVMGAFLGAMNFLTVDKELEKEKNPERIATILYKKKLVASKTKAVAKTKKAPKNVMQRSPKNPSKPKPKRKVTPTKVKPKRRAVRPKNASRKRSRKAPAKLARPNKGPTNKKTVVRSKPKRSVAKPAPAPTKGPVDTYKSADFKSSVSALLSKGSSLKNAKVKTVSESSVGYGRLSGVDAGATAKTAKVSSNVGNLAGAASGKLDPGQGLEGITSKATTYAAGIPSKTVVLGGMDPDVIRKILERHIPQFRYCYQQELDRTKNALSGVIRMNFIIGASGHVTKAGVTSERGTLPPTVKGCVVRVIRGISFPAPRGGGVVEVNQPMNFYPTTGG